MLPLSPTDFTPAKAPEYHWSPANQPAFLEALSTTGNVSESAKAVSMSGQAAYAFCNRAAGRVFRLGWDAAVLVARRRVEGELLERALVGQEEIYERDPDTGCVRRTRIHNGTTMAMLTRLDRMASRTSDVPADTVMAQIVAQDFERFLDMVEAGGGGAEAMLFLKRAMARWYRWPVLTPQNLQSTINFPGIVRISMMMTWRKNHRRWTNPT